MNQQTSDKLSKLLARLDPPSAFELARVIERARLKGTSPVPSDLVLDALRPRLRLGAAPSRQFPPPHRHFAQPFEDMLIDRHGAVKRRGRIARTSIMPVWTWLEEDLLSETLPEMVSSITAHTLAEDEEGLSAAIAVLHDMTSQALLDVLRVVGRSARLSRAAKARLGGAAALEDARDMAGALAVAPYILRLQRIVSRPLEKFDRDTVLAVRGIYSEAVESCPEQAPFVVLALMGRLKEPSQVLRLARSMTKNVTDSLLGQSDIAVIGELLLSEIEETAAWVERQRPGQSDLSEVLERLVQLDKRVNGLLAEIDINKHGPWGQRLLAVRSRVSEAISDHLLRISGDVEAALPMKGRAGYRQTALSLPDLDSAPDARASDRAKAALAFLARLRPLAERAGLSHRVRDIQAAVVQYLDLYRDHILEAARRQGPEAAQTVSLYVGLCADLYQALHDFQSAELLRRRGRLALNAF